MRLPVAAEVEPSKGVLPTTCTVAKGRRSLGSGAEGKAHRGMGAWGLVDTAHELRITYFCRHGR